MIYEASLTLDHKVSNRYTYFWLFEASFVASLFGSFSINIGPADKIHHLR
jgi:hypothetical protein